MIGLRTLINRALCALFWTGILVVPVAVSYAQQSDLSAPRSSASPYITLDEENLLVLEVRIGSNSTGHGLIAYQHGDAVLLPLGELCSILELGIMVDASHGVAQGWVLEEDRTFNLNLGSRTIVIDGSLTPLPPEPIGYDSNDIYIVSTLLEKWLPVDLEINLPRMHVKITPRETLPFQSRLKRDEQRSYWLSRQGNEADSYPMQMAPYRMWSYPLVDATAGFLTGRQNSSTRLALQSHADLAGLSTDLFVSHVGRDNNSQTVARLEAGRWDPDGGLLGPAGATRYEVGDLFINRVPLISTSKQGLGFMISSMPLNQSSEMDFTEIQGDAPPGWEAELYINGVLYDFQTVGESGQYFFTDVPMVYGKNIFRTVLYGPRGEKREIVKNSNLSAEMADVGQMKYKLILVKEGQGLLTRPPARDYIDSDAWNQQLELSYAVAAEHALVANFSRLKIEGRQELFSSLTSHNSLGRVYLETILARSMRGGEAFSLAARGRIRGQNLFASHKISSDYRAEAYSSTSLLARQTQVRSSGSLFGLGKSPLYYNVSATNRHFEQSDLRQDNELKLNLSANLGRLILSHNIRYQDKKYSDLITKQNLGTQLARIQMGSISLRGDLNYEISPNQMRSVGSSLNWFQTDRIQLAARGTHFIKPEFGNDNLGVDLTVFFDRFSLGANYSYFKSVGSSIGLTLGTSLTRDNRSNCYAMQYRRMANHAVASVRAYVDLNQNRVFDEGDEPLEGVGFLKLTAWQKIRTNKDGVALLTGLQAHRSQAIKLDLSTVADPYLVPISEGVNVVGHPGSFTDVDFPFSYMGEMEGVVLDGEAMDTPMRHVGLEILDSEGQRVKTTVVEFDGYYYFPELFPGQYTLAVIPTTINTNRYEVPEPAPFVIPAEGGFVTGPDIYLQRKKVEAVDEDEIDLTYLTPAEPETEPMVAAAAPEEESPPQVTAPEPVTTPEPVTEPVVAAAAPNAETLSPVAETQLAQEAQEAQEAMETPEPVVAAITPEADLTPSSTPTAAEPEPEPDEPVLAQQEPTEPASPRTMSPELKAMVQKADPVILAEDFPEFDRELTLSLVYEVLYRNSLWPVEE